MASYRRVGRAVSRPAHASGGIAVLTLLTVLGGGAAYAAVEKGQDLNTLDGVWWAVTTMTTVGYGDSYPTTSAGRAIAVVVMLVGIGFVAVLTAAAAERFMRGREAEQQRDELISRLDEIARRLDAIERAARVRASSVHSRSRSVRGSYCPSAPSRASSS
jgi:hypothetical protein